MEVERVLYHHDETINYLFFQYKLARSIWSTIPTGSTLYPLRIFLAFGSMVSILGLNYLLGWKRLLAMAL
jgi:hypothetical protein